MGWKKLGVNMSRLAMFHLWPALQVFLLGHYPNYRHKKVHFFLFRNKGGADVQLAAVFGRTMSSQLVLEPLFVTSLHDAKIFLRVNLADILSFSGSSRYVA